MYLKHYDLSGKVAVVTGGGRGIGLACAEALGEAGATVVLAEIDPAVAETGRAYLAGLGYKVEVASLNVTNSENATAVADELVARLGRVDILVNNAGIARSDTPAETVTDEHWLNVMDVNVNGVFWCCRAFGNHMLKQGSGSIVNIGSMSGYIVNKPQPQSYYNASKAAVHHLTKSLAAEWAPRNVRVNAVAPGYIRTPLNEFAMNDKRMFPVWMDGTPMNRLGEPSEIAAVVLFLASSASTFVTGSIVVADGGYTCW